ncbi:hypothetical protein GCM10025771_07960 [Niveibacterium umoris]|uniref:DUF4424 domain-containing protein n=1 Tax=Niveibacterium umoris TaxID=1193620 RepID=A0A840BTH3_9RHOO|nr:DUF4424 family protein [Niveibacterium umoris]MBB4013657.1 hypothetical protein [Niveibacterium umoris]
MQMMRQGISTALCYMLFAAGPAIAWESESGAVFPALVGTLPEGISLKATNVRLSAESVVIEYTLQNSTVKPKSFKLSSYLAPFGWQGAAAEYNDLHFPEVALKVDGKPQIPRTRVSALLDGDEIAASLRRSAIDPYLVAREDVKTDERAIAKRVAQKQLPAEAFRAGLPIWQLQVTRSWLIRLSVQRETVLGLRYRVRPAFRPVKVGGSDWQSLILQHCGNPKQVGEALAELEPSSPEYRNVEVYTIPVKVANAQASDVDLSIDLQAKGSGSKRASASLTCNAYSGTGQLGLPSVSTTQVLSPSQLSVLVIY